MPPHLPSSSERWLAAIAPITTKQPTTASHPADHTAITPTADLADPADQADDSAEQTTQQHSRQLPTLDEFLRDLEHRQSLESIPICRNPFELASYLEQTGQEDDPIELVQAREAALATTGIFADCTPTIAYHLTIGSMDTYRAEKARQQSLVGAIAPTKANQLEPNRAPKRAAAQKASTAWAELSPRKRQRRE